MENYDERRRHSNQSERHRARPGYEERGGGRESWREWSQEDQRPSRRERGWLDYDTSYGRGDDRRYGREEQRYGESRDERPRFSPQLQEADADKLGLYAVQRPPPRPFRDESKAYFRHHRANVYISS